MKKVVILLVISLLIVGLFASALASKPEEQIEQAINKLQKAQNALENENDCKFRFSSTH